MPWPDGFLHTTDRLKNIIGMGGQNLAPQPLENVVARSPFVAQVVMIGDRRPFPSMLIVPDSGRLRAWAEQQGIPTGDRAALLAYRRLVALLEEKSPEWLHAIGKHERPKKVAVLPEEFTTDARPLKPKLSIKRRGVEESPRRDGGDLRGGSSTGFPTRTKRRGGAVTGAAPPYVVESVVRQGAFFTQRSIQSTISASACITDSRAR
jgi:long-chain acyl-CoA synthetase